MPATGVAHVGVFDLMILKKDGDQVDRSCKNDV